MKQKKFFVIKIKEKGMIQDLIWKILIRTMKDHLMNMAWVVEWEIKGEKHMHEDQIIHLVTFDKYIVFMFKILYVFLYSDC